MKTNVTVTWPTKPEQVRVVQYFSDDYLLRCRELSPAEIARFLEEFRRNFAAAETVRGSLSAPPSAPRSR